MSDCNFTGDPESEHANGATPKFLICSDEEITGDWDCFKPLSFGVICYTEIDS